MHVSVHGASKVAIHAHPLAGFSSIQSLKTAAQFYANLYGIPVPASMPDPDIFITLEVTPHVPTLHVFTRWLLRCVRSMQTLVCSAACSCFHWA